MLVMWRDALRWVTEGAWVQGLPDNFQWFGLGQSSGEIAMVLIALVLFAAFAWSLRNLVIGRTVYAVGSDTEAARLAGINSPSVVFWVFVIMGGLVARGEFVERHPLYGDSRKPGCRP